MSLTARGVPLAGAVSRFDDTTGWGVVEAQNGVAYPFHCTAIADGSRMIEPGIAVTFHLTPGHRGVWEAAGVTPR
ncbi:MAG: cold shock domain-containing protein [bacterium]|nr:cold shock domain-containing protein [bacterium]